MIWSSVEDFLYMGGYGLYVWGSLLMVAAALAWEALLLVQRHRRAVVELQQQAMLRTAAWNSRAALPRLQPWPDTRHWSSH